ncbi:MAG: hypothetical protein ACFFC3_00660 [Candidatus Odinarchaeota archaeon]
MFRKEKKRYAIIILYIIIAITIPSILYGIYIYGHSPVHRINIDMVDPSGDVSNPDIDIIEYRSYKSSEWRQNHSSAPYFIVLEIFVLGTVNEDCYYRFTVVARRTNDEIGHIYSFLYNSGECDENFDIEIENSSIRMYFPINRLIPGDYITGMEVLAGDFYERDLTPEERDAPIARLYW